MAWGAREHVLIQRFTGQVTLNRLLRWSCSQPCGLFFSRRCLLLAFLRCAGTSPLALRSEREEASCSAN